MSVYDDDLMRFCRQMASVTPVLDGLHYRGMHDFLAQHGKAYEPRKKAVKLPWGAPKCCYGNALAAAVKYGWTYVEGIALGVIPVQHAWNVRDDGEMVDLTWRQVGSAYLGVEFSIGRADDCTWNGDATVLDDWRRGWPILQQPWTGEDWDREWDYSRPIRAAMTMSEKRLQSASLSSIYAKW